MKRLIPTGLTLAASLLLASSAIAAEMPDIDIEYEKFTLDNGLTVVVHEDRKAPIVAVSVWYHVGSKNEPPGKTGFARNREMAILTAAEAHPSRVPGRNTGRVR